MALTIKAGFGTDLVELAEDLEAVEHGLSKLLGEIIGEKVQPIVAEMQGLLPYDSAHRGWRGETKRRDPGHIRDSLKGELNRSGAVIRTSHPGGPVHWWGGVISPRNAEIEIRKHPEGGEDFTSSKAEEVGRALEDAVERFLQRRGL